MKTRFFLVQFIMIFILISCTKNENDKIDDGITFRYYDLETDTTPTLVYYNEILGYDSVKHAFVLDELAWNRIEKKITPVVPDPNFGFFVALNNKNIYAATYIQPYSSLARKDLITFNVKKPNIVFIKLGYPEVSKNKFIGEDLRNDSRIIKRLKTDNKLIEHKN